MSIIINGFQIDKTYILDTLAQGSVLLAVKFVKDNSDLGLKECKTVIDNLRDDPNYYDGKEHIIESIPDESWETLSEVKQVTSDPTPMRRKNQYEKDDNKTSYNLYIALFILIVIAGSVYFYFNK